VCGSVGSIYNQDNQDFIQNTLYLPACTHNGTCKDNQDFIQNTLYLPACTHSGISSNDLILVINPQSHNKSATSMHDLFHNNWLARYPQPQFIVFDNGKIGKCKLEFIICVQLTNMALKPNKLQSTTINSQANAIIERVHKVLCCQ
jgi:hypothetical protein